MTINNNSNKLRMLKQNNALSKKSRCQDNLEISSENSVANAPSGSGEAVLATGQAGGQAAGQTVLAEQLEVEAVKVKAEAEKAKEKVKAEAVKVKAEAEKAKEKVKAEAVKAKTEAEKAKAEAEKAKEKVKAAKEKVKVAKVSPAVATLADTVSQITTLNPKVIIFKSLKKAIGGKYATSVTPTNLTPYTSNNIPKEDENKFINQLKENHLTIEQTLNFFNIKDCKRGIFSGFIKNKDTITDIYGICDWKIDYLLGNPIRVFRTEKCWIKEGDKFSTFKFTISGNQQPSFDNNGIPVDQNKWPMTFNSSAIAGNGIEAIIISSTGILAKMDDTILRYTKNASNSLIKDSANKPIQDESMVCQWKKYPNKTDTTLNSDIYQLSIFNLAGFHSDQQAPIGVIDYIFYNDECLNE
ncbi:hypothetical protein CPAV1605_1528 [seawater metagenome]|uniref:Uncharacterized protein n=1 Tax=seawater metagenome TaxID=1561972 RepID=A0A5E8CMD7_9ZZZZ